MKTCFKVLTSDMKSVGLLGARPLKYRHSKWTRPLEPLSDHPRKGGGLWAVKKLSHARQIKKYLKKKHGINARIFHCRIGKIIYQSSYRIKTDKVMLLAEVS